MHGTTSKCESWYPPVPQRPSGKYEFRTTSALNAAARTPGMSRERGYSVAADITEHLPEHKRTVPSERKLAQGILLCALIDYGDPHDHAVRNDAAAFLFGTDTRDLAYWCDIADTSVEHVRNAAHDVPHRAHKKAYRYLLHPPIAGTDGAL